MIEAIKQRLTYANVMATIAVFIALGGSSYAALSITGRDVRNSSLTYRDLKRNTLGGSRIKESQLGRVPRARNAERLNGVSAARLLVKCPEGTTPVYDVCVETGVRGPAPYREAALACEEVGTPSAPGRRLPNHDELLTAVGNPGVTIAPAGELTREVFPAATPGQVQVLYVTDDVGSVALTPNTAAGAKPFRCVTDPLN